MTMTADLGSGQALKPQSLDKTSVSNAQSGEKVPEGQHPAGRWSTGQTTPVKSGVKQ